MKRNVSNHNIVEQITAGHYFVGWGFFSCMSLTPISSVTLNILRKFLSVHTFGFLWLKGQRNKGMLLCRAL